MARTLAFTLGDTEHAVSPVKVDPLQALRTRAGSPTDWSQRREPSILKSACPAQFSL